MPDAHRDPDGNTGLELDGVVLGKELPAPEITKTCSSSLGWTCSGGLEPGGNVAMDIVIRSDSPV